MLPHTQFHNCVVGISTRDVGVGESGSMGLEWREMPAGGRE